MGDNLARERVQPRSTLAVPAAARKPAPEAEPEAGTVPPAGDVLELLPRPDSAYMAYGRPSNKPEITLHVLLKDGYWRGFAWSDYAGVGTAPPDSPGFGPALVVRFAGLEPTELRILGRNLGKLQVCIGHHRIVWIRELPSDRGFSAAARDDRAEVITCIVIRPWEPERQADKK